MALAYRECCAACYHWNPNDDFGRCGDVRSPHFNHFTNGALATCAVLTPLPLPADEARLALINEVP